MREYVRVTLELTLSTVLQDADPLTDVSQVQSCLVVTTHVLPDLSYKRTVHNCYFTETHTSMHINKSLAQLKKFLEVSISLTDLHHLAQLCQVASDEVEEGELVKVLGPLVAHFHNLVVTLQQCCFAQTLPAAALIQGLGSLKSHLEAKRKRNVEKMVLSLTQK